MGWCFQLATIICALGLAAGCDTKPARDYTTIKIPANFKDHSSSLGYSIKLSPKWEIDNKGNAEFFFAPQDGSEFRPNMNVTTTDTGGLTNLSAAARAAEKEISKRVQNMKVEASEPLKLSGDFKAHLLIYTGRMDMNGQSYKLKWAQVLAAKGSNGFIVTFTSMQSQYDALWPEVQQMFASFRVR